MDNDEWQKHGRDAAHDDIARHGAPCATLDEARRRCGAWLRSQPELCVTDADVEQWPADLRVQTFPEAKP